MPLFQKQIYKYLRTGFIHLVLISPYDNGRIQNQGNYIFYYRIYIVNFGTGQIQNQTKQNFSMRSQNKVYSYTVPQTREHSASADEYALH